jgi:hypothetical protein
LKKIAGKEKQLSKAPLYNFNSNQHLQFLNESDKQNSTLQSNFKLPMSASNIMNRRNGSHRGGYGAVQNTQSVHGAMQEQFYTDTSTGRKGMKQTALPHLAGRTIGEQFEQVMS